MKKSKQIIAVVLSLVLSLVFPFLGTNVAKAASVIYNNTEGSDGAYTYALWKDYGETSMTLNGNGKFECWWQNIGNALFRDIPHGSGKEDAAVRAGDHEEKRPVEGQ